MLNFIKECWNNLHEQDRSVLFVISLCIVAVMTIITWVIIMVAIFSGPEMYYKCSDAQAERVERTITECLKRDDTYMSSCVDYAKEAHCSTVERNEQVN